MGAMIGGVASRELNNPLTSILGVSELLQDSQTTDAARKQIGILQQQARRAAEIVHNLTYFATPPVPGKTPVSLAEIVERTLNLHAYSLRKNSITVDFLRTPNQPMVKADPHQLMQVFLNLILNANTPSAITPRPGDVAHTTGEQRGLGVGELSRRWSGDSAGGPGQHLRSFLYDEASRSGNRTWAQHLQIGGEGNTTARLRRRMRSRWGISVHGHTEGGVTELDAN